MEGQVHPIDHPLVQHKLTLMRRKDCSTSNFRRLLQEISMLLAYEVTRDMPTTLHPIETPLAAMQAPLLDGKKIVLISILRAGSGILDGMLGGEKPAGAIVFDCICRNLILGDRFGDAVRGISEELGGVPLAGFETYGEIALDAGDLSGFHNTTTVVLAFPQ